MGLIDRLQSDDVRHKAGLSKTMELNIKAERKIEKSKPKENQSSDMGHTSKRILRWIMPDWPRDTRGLGSLVPRSASCPGSELPEI